MTDTDLPMTQAWCTTCKAPILWTRKPAGTFNRPLDMHTAEKRYIIGIDGALMYVDSYNVHNCDSKPPRAAKVVSHKEYGKPKAEQKLGVMDLHQTARSVTCPVEGCAAAPGAPCIDLVEVVRREVRTTARGGWTHHQRMRVAVDEGDMQDKVDMARFTEEAMRHADLRVMADINKGNRLRMQDNITKRNNARVNDRIKCDTCGASKGVQCWNLAERRKGNTRVHTANPHPGRTHAYLDKYGTFS